MISHDSYHHQGRRVSDRPVVFWLKFWIRRASDERRRALTSTAFVSEEKETSARGRLVGIARAVHRRSRLRVSFSCLVCFPLVVVLWCVGNPDLWDRGLVCFGEPLFCGLFTPTNPLPGHRLVPESHFFFFLGGKVARATSTNRRMYMHALMHMFFYTHI